MIPSKLVHDTGTMIRFRTSQLGQLPSASGDIELLLPTGRLVISHFNRNPQNPNVSGPELVRFIKHRIAFGQREDVLVEQRSARLWVVHLLESALAVAGAARVPERRVRAGVLNSADVLALTAYADRENERGRRIETYARVLRPSSLRRLVLGVVGARCMAHGCRACEEFDTQWGRGSGSVIVDVHHIEHVARAIDHHPRNLCVLCGNHHRFVHGSGAWSIRHDGPDVVFQRGNREMIVRRPPALFDAP